MDNKKDFRIVAVLGVDTECWKCGRKVHLTPKNPTCACHTPEDTRQERLKRMEEHDAGKR